MQTEQETQTETFMVLSPYPSLKSIFWIHKTIYDGIVVDIPKYDGTRIGWF